MSTKTVFYSAYCCRTGKITEDAFNKGANYYIMKPFNHTILLDRIKSIRKKPAVFEKKNEESIQEVSSRRENLESRVTNMLHEIGIPAHIKGYHYLRDAIMMAVNDMDVLNAITKILYPTVAKNTGQRQAASNGQFDMRSRWHGAAENWIRLMSFLDIL